MSPYPQVRPYFGGGSGIAPALTIVNHFYRNHGARYTGIMCSDFTSIKRALEGEDVRPLIEDRLEAGFTEARQWMLNNGVIADAGFPEGLHPNQYPNYYDGVRKHWELYGSYGLAVQATAFTATDPMMTNVDDQHRHWERTQEAARGLSHVRLELVNEYDWGLGQNSPDKSLYQMRPVGIIASSGSSVADAAPPMPLWDVGLYHSNGLSQWQRKCPHNPWEDIVQKFGILAEANENTRPDSDPNVRHFYDAARAAALLIAAACYHSKCGKFSVRFDDFERPFAKAWADGARSVPLEFQDGAYRHRIDLESFKVCPTCQGSGVNDGHECSTCDATGQIPDEGTPENPGVLRAYERVLPDGRSHLVLIHY